MQKHAFRPVCAAAGLLGFSALLLRGFYENTAMLCVQHDKVQLQGLPKIVQISDLHKARFGTHQIRLLSTVEAQSPELIVITGDLISRTERDLTETEYLLKRLRKLAPVLAVPGNHELDLPPSLYREYRAMMHRCDVIYLANKSITLNGIRYSGITLAPGFYRGGGLLGFRGKYTCTAQTLRDTLGDATEKNVLLAHDPLRFPAYAEWGAALTLSGHVHGGAVRLPVVGGVFSPERNFFPRYDKGYFKIGNSELIVSGGLGKLRLFNPPEIRVIESMEV